MCCCSFHSKPWGRSCSRRHSCLSRLTVVWLCCTLCEQQGPNNTEQWGLQDQPRQRLGSALSEGARHYSQLPAVLANKTGVHLHSNLLTHWPWFPFPCGPQAPITCPKTTLILPFFLHPLASETLSYCWNWSRISTCSWEMRMWMWWRRPSSPWPSSTRWPCR